MDTDKWLNNFIFDTSLAYDSFLSEKELDSLKGYFLEKKTLNQIGKEINLTNERVRQLVQNGMGKILLNAKGLIAKKEWLEKTLKEKEILLKELSDLKLKFKKELADSKQLTLRFEEKDVPIINMPYSVRARNVLKKLNIKTANQLAQLSLARLNSVEKAGVKTVHEIIRRAEEFGIKII